MEYKQVCLVEKLSSTTSIVFLQVKEHFVVFLLKSSQIKSQTWDCCNVMNITNYIFTV